MRVVAIGDIGVVDDMMHIGDEAMFESALDAMAARGADVVGVSSAPAESSARYGIEAVGRIGFDGLARDAAESRLEAVLALAQGGTAFDRRMRHARSSRPLRKRTPWSSPGEGTWPRRGHCTSTSAQRWRASPHRLRRPLVVSGQTLGPTLLGRDRELVGELVRSARLVGVRESSSLALAAELGRAARVGVDDASFLGMTEQDAAPAPSGVLVSLSLSLDRAPRAQTVDRVAALVDAAAETVGGPVRFHAHYGPLAGTEPRGDAVLHEEVRDRMRIPSTVVPTGGARQAASLARSAALLITGRYHPAVFAAPGGCAGAGPDHRRIHVVKQRGVLAHWGQDGTVPIGAADDEGIALMRTLWADRDRIADQARTRLPAYRSAAADWWDAVAARCAE